MTNIPTATMKSYERRLMRAHRYIQDHLDQPLTLETLAAAACFSPYHFHRIFSAMTGETVSRHIRRLRLARAAWALCHTTDGVLDVALGAGFEAPESFSRAFKDYFGVTPSDYRNRNSGFVRPEAPDGPHFAPARLMDAPSPPLSRSPLAEDRPTFLDIAVKTVSAQTLAALRHVGPYLQAGAVFGRCHDLASEAGVVGPDSLMAMICHDDPAIGPPDKLRADCAVTVSPATVLPKDSPLSLIAAPGGPAAIAMVTGPYEKLHDAYTWLYGSWLPASGYEAEDAPCIEYYHTSPAEVAPQDLLTEIRMMVRKA